MNGVMRMDIPDIRIGVVGGGSWGTALANLLAEKGYPIDLRLSVHCFDLPDIHQTAIPASAKRILSVLSQST